MKICFKVLETHRSVYEPRQVSYGHGKPGKVMEFLNGHFQAWKSHGKTSNHKSFGKVMEVCYNHLFIYAEFEIINIYF